MRHAAKPSHELTLLQGSQEYFPALVAALDAACEEVRFETYIFDFTAGSLAVAQALARAAERGVQVWVVLDGLGTPFIPPQWVARWQAAGVRWRIFDPLGVFPPVPDHSLPPWRNLHDYRHCPQWREG